jgi:ABC-type transporter Mla maintaining outer membrane lipid asymmetry permease subunit MlaE
MADESLSEVPGAPAATKEKRSILATFFNPFGGFAIRLNNDLGAMAIFFARAFVLIFRRKQFVEIINQVYFIGARSASIVMLVGFFTGMVLGLQLYYVMNKFGAVGFLGTAVTPSPPCGSTPSATSSARGSRPPSSASRS